MATGRDKLCLCDATDLSRVLHFAASPIFSWAHVVPSFCLSPGRKLGHAMCQLGNRGTVVLYCSEDFSANLRKSALIAVGHLPAFLYFYPLIWRALSSYTSREAMMSLFSHLTGQNHQILRASKKANYLEVFEKSQHRIQSHISLGLKMFWPYGYLISFHHYPSVAYFTPNCIKHHIITSLTCCISTKQSTVKNKGKYNTDWLGYQMWVSNVKN